MHVFIKIMIYSHQYSDKNCYDIIQLDVTTVSFESTHYDVIETEGFVELTLVLSKSLPFEINLLLYSDNITNTCELHSTNIL